jgi:hypothetical protein
MWEQAMQERLFDQAMQALAQGDRTATFQLLRQVIMKNNKHAHAWYWMSRLVETEAQVRECLERALAIDPNYREAQEALEELRLRDLVQTFRAPVFEEQRREPPKLGQSLLQKKLITDAQLQEALREQINERNRGKQTMLGLILLRRKMISPLALAAILVEQQEQRGAAEKLGDYLLMKGYITRDRLEQAIAEHALMSIYEKPIRFGEMLVKRGYIRDVDLDRALDEQRQDAYNKYYY